MSIQYVESVVRILARHLGVRASELPPEELASVRTVADLIARFRAWVHATASNVRVLRPLLADHSRSSDVSYRARALSLTHDWGFTPLSLIVVLLDLERRAECGSKAQRAARLAGECEAVRGLRLLEAWALRVVLAHCVEHGQTSLLAGDDLGHYLVAAAAAGGCPAMIPDLSHVAGASGADGTTDISVGEGVAVTHEHLEFLKRSLLIVKINFNFIQLGRIHKCPTKTII